MPPGGARLRALALGAFLAHGTAHALLEVSGNYGYAKNLYGRHKQNERTSENYTGTVALPLISPMTAIELIYSESKSTALERSITELDDNVSITSTKRRVKTVVAGASIRQSLAPLGATLRPSVSLGYARLITSGRAVHTLDDERVTGEVLTRTQNWKKTEDDSFYANLAIQVRLTSRLSFRWSIQSVMPDFELDDAEDNVTYLAGASLRI